MTTQEISVTIKQGAGYDCSWFVFKGPVTSVHSDLVSFFGLDPEASDGLTTFQLAEECTAIAHKTAVAPTPPKAQPKAARKAAPKAQPKAETKAEPSTAETSEPLEIATEPAPEAVVIASDVWDTVEVTPAPGLSEAEQRIGSCATLEDLTALWYAEGSSFDQETTELWKARGRELKQLEEGN